MDSVVLVGTTSGMVADSAVVVVVVVFGASAAEATVSGLAASSTPAAITAITSPTLTMSPTSPAKETTLPPLGEGIVTAALSVSISTSCASSSTLSPAATYHLRISPSAIPSPRSGSLNSYIANLLELKGFGYTSGDGFNCWHKCFLTSEIRGHDIVTSRHQVGKLSVDL